MKGKLLSRNLKNQRKFLSFFWAGVREFGTLPIRPQTPKARAEHFAGSIKSC